jgi:DNA helicase-2/ATP-dependent DNA helicase PcrA
LIAPNFELSKYQKNFCEAVVENRDHISVEATAGSSKTTSALMALKLIPKFQRTIFLSFSNQIVKELKEKVPPHVKASTLHSLGHGFVTAYYPGIKVEPNKYLRLALDHYQTKKKEIFKKAYQIQDISQYARMTLTKLDMDELEKMCDNYDLDFSEETISIAIQLIRNDDYPRFMDFADMIFYPAIKEDMIQESFHNVFLDEAQDLNNAQIQFAQNILKDNGRIISLGDSWQSIYGFAGSDINSFKKLKSIEGTKELPLSISYRCARKIVEEAQNICPTIEAAPNAKEGIVRWGEYDEMKEGDMVLCRNNAPLVDLYYRLIEKGIKARIIGKEIEKGIIELAETCMTGHKDGFMNNLRDRLDNITQELVLRGVTSPQKHIRYSNFSDKMDLLEIICEKVRSTAEIIPTIKGIFVEESDGVKLMTLHKSKGLENDRVFIMKNYKGKQLIPSQYAVMDWQLKQEENLEFVGITRAKNELVYFNLLAR